MDRDAKVNNRLAQLIATLTELTRSRDLPWEKQSGSAHRYARWNNYLLILGPNAPVSETSVPRYLFVTPFDSPSCIEINSSDEKLGGALLELVAAVESATRNEPATDPFAITDEFLENLP
jgi:hypothetical protein